jgi:hypothetical protein
MQITIRTPWGEGDMKSLTAVVTMQVSIFSDENQKELSSA